MPSKNILNLEKDNKSLLDNKDNSYLKINEATKRDSNEKSNNDSN